MPVCMVVVGQLQSQISKEKTFLKKRIIFSYFMLAKISVEYDWVMDYGVLVKEGENIYLNGEEFNLDLGKGQWYSRAFTRFFPKN